MAMAGLKLRGRGQNLEIDAAPFRRARADLSEKHLSFTRCSFQLGYQDNVPFYAVRPGSGETMRKAISVLAPGLIIAAAVASGCNLAWAQNCPGNPDALGTSRVLALDPRKYPRVGAMDHAVALPLSGKEVVLTFDDGPIPRYSNQ